MINAIVTVTLHCADERIFASLLHSIDLMTAPPSGRDDWTREIRVEREGNLDGLSHHGN